MISYWCEDSGQRLPPMMWLCPRVQRKKSVALTSLHGVCFVCFCTNPSCLIDPYYHLPFPSLLHELLVLLRVHDLLRHFHKNAQGDLHCPVTFKVCDRGRLASLGMGQCADPDPPDYIIGLFFLRVCLYLGGGIFHLPKTCCWDSRNNQPICGFLGLKKVNQ